jgi:hypothetical protein
MMRSLVWDLLSFLLPLVAGACAFLLGRSFQRCPKALRVAIIAASLLGVAVGVLSLGGLLPVQVRSVLSWLGGGTTMLCWSALILLGIVWSVPRRSMSTGFLAVLVAIAACMVFIDASGSLWWRFLAPETWQRYPDEQGQLQQSSGLTCSPTAAVMLLAQYGVRASEGEMAYLAGTSLFGTDAESIARALGRKVEPMGWKAQERQTTYEECLKRNEPFIAHVQGKYLGHAVLVEAMFVDKVRIVDPASGLRETVSRTEFESIWDGTAISLIKQG